jgi:hypothetical protein
MKLFPLQAFPSKIRLLVAFTALGALPLACSNGADDAPGNGGSGGQPTGGGSSTGGGAPSAGGGVATSGGASTGGNSTGGTAAGGTASGGAQGELGGMAGELNPELFVVPDGVTLRELSGSEGGLTLTALTFQATAEGFELYATVKNAGSEPICYGGMTVTFFDATEQALTTWGEALFSDLYRMDEGAGGFIQCVAGGETALTGTQKLPEGIVIGQLAVLEYSLPAFGLDGVVENDDVSVSPLQLVQVGAETAFSGVIYNNLSETIANPSLAVFTLNEKGRPVGMATASETTEIPAGETWQFDTNPVRDTGSEAVAFPKASIPE